MRKTPNALNSREGGRESEGERQVGGTKGGMVEGGREGETEREGEITTASIHD